jgi:hypothetical protein
MPRHARFFSFGLFFVEHCSGSHSYLVHCEATPRPSETYRACIAEMEGGHDTASEHRSLRIDRVPDHVSIGGWPIRHTSRLTARRQTRPLRRRCRDPGATRGRRGIDRLLHYSRRGACDPRGRHLGPCAILLRFSCTIVHVEHPIGDIHWREQGDANDPNRAFACVKLVAFASGSGDPPSAILYVPVRPSSKVSAADSESGIGERLHDRREGAPAEPYSKAT